MVKILESLTHILEGRAFLGKIFLVGGGVQEEDIRLISYINKGELRRQ